MTPMGAVTTLINRVFAIKLIQPIIPSNLEKARFHSGIILTVFAMSESPKFHQITKNTNLVSKKGKIGWHREAQHHIFSGTRRRGTRMWANSSSSAAAQQQQQQQQHNRCNSGGGGGGEGGVGGGSTASLFLHSTAIHFFAQLSQQHGGPLEGEEREAI